MIKMNEIIINLTQLVWTTHNICKIWGSNPGHHKKKKYTNICLYIPVKEIFSNIIFIKKLFILTNFLFFYISFFLCFLLEGTYLYLYIKG